MVEVVASMAQAASMALPPSEKMRAPELAASGLPVMAIQCLPCSIGLLLAQATGLNQAVMQKAQTTKADNCRHTRTTGNWHSTDLELATTLPPL